MKKSFTLAIATFALMPLAAHAQIVPDTIIQDAHITFVSPSTDVVTADSVNRAVSDARQQCRIWLKIHNKESDAREFAASQARLGATVVQSSGFYNVMAAEKAMMAALEPLLATSSCNRLVNTSHMETPAKQ